MRWGFAVTILIGVVMLKCALGQEARLREIDPRRTIPLTGNVHPKAQAQFDEGPVEGSMKLSYISLILRPSVSQQAALERLLTEQQDRSSPNFHKWLTPEQYADQFGFNASDVSKIESWLESEGFTIVGVARGRNWVAFGGTAEQVTKAFHTELHYYRVDGERYVANAGEPSIPKALEHAVFGLTGLHNFFPKARGRVTTLDNPNPDNVLGNGTHSLAPSDLATIYDINPLYKAGVDGTGQKIAIVGAVAINLTDIQAFRSLFHLSPTSPPFVVYGLDALTSGSSYLLEADLDIELAGAIAPNASIIYVYASDILYHAVPYAVDQDLAPIISTSFAICERNVGGNDYAAGRSYAQQANAQGITWLAASGDSGAAGCDRPDAGQQATHGAVVQHPADIPEVTAVGGTEFNEGSGVYWGLATGEPALSYIPEIAWNDSVLDNDLAASGGGVSLYYPRPPWQANLAIPGSTRAVPDVALTASGSHDPYWIYSNGQWQPIGGTSAATPVFAGIIALLNQYEGANGQGNINPNLYRLAQTTTNVFHDVTAGNNIVPCWITSQDCTNGALGYTAGAGYDLVTGLGSVDAAQLVSQWGQPGSTTTTLSANRTSFSLGDAVQLTATVNAVSSSVVPSGIVSFVTASASLGSTSLASNGTAATASLTVLGSQFSVGNNTITAIYGGATGLNGSSGSTVVTVTQIPTVTVLNKLTSNTNGLVNNSCSIPSQVTNFTPSSLQVWVIFDVTGAAVGDSAQISLFRPDSILYGNINEPVSEVGNNGYKCFSYPINISGASAASYPGTWTIAVSWDHSSASLFTLSFTLSAPSQQPALQIFPHIASDSQWHTDIFVLNTNRTPANFTLAFHTDTGAVLSLDGNPQTSNVTLAPNGIAFFRTSPATTPNEGWAELDSNVPLSGVVVYGQQGADGSYYEASAPLSSPYLSFTVPFDETVSPHGSPFLDGFAFANTDPSKSAHITCTAYGVGGNILGSGLEVGPLGPLQHTEFLVDQQFGSLLAGQRGILACQSTTFVAAVELRAISASPAVSSMPVIPGSTSSALSSSQVFPHIASDSQWHTDIFVLNTNSAPANFTLAFHTDTGAVLSLDGNPQTSNVTLAANGIAFFRTSPATTANEGWAELNSSMPLSGVVVYGRSGADGSYYEAPAPLSSPYLSFTVPFDETVSPLGSPFLDGFAIANTFQGKSAQITCTAYGSSGNVLGSGLPVGPLNPLQHTEFLVDQQFGSLLAGQRGMLACQSTTPVAAVELRAISSSPAVSSMPVIPTARIN
jgi:hypothetical protein